MKMIYDQALREEARALKRAGLTHKAVGEKLGIRRGSVDNILKTDLLVKKTDAETAKRARDMALSLSWTTKGRSDEA